MGSQDLETDLGSVWIFDIWSGLGEESSMVSSLSIAADNHYREFFKRLLLGRNVGKSSRDWNIGTWKTFVY